MLPKICIEDFIRYTESLFDGFLSTGGEKINDDGEEKYQLFYSRALREYLKNCKDGRSPKFTNNNISLYLNRCGYYIYPEKRKNEYKDKAGNVVDPPEVFSGKCVNLFYELSGVEFYFLRITPLDECADVTCVEFRKMQQDYLVNLFEMTVKYLCSFQKKETPLTAFDLKFFWELLYRKYRYQLSKKFFLVFNLQHSLFLNEELFSWLTSVTTAYREMRNLVKTAYDNEWEYIIHENDKPTQNMQDRYYKMIKRLKKLIR